MIITDWIHLLWPSARMHFVFSKHKKQTKGGNLVDTIPRSFQEGCECTENTRGRREGSSDHDFDRTCFLDQSPFVTELPVMRKVKAKRRHDSDLKSNADTRGNNEKLERRFMRRTSLGAHGCCPAMSKLSGCIRSFLFVVRHVSTPYTEKGCVLTTN